jgi:hypothetical protein
MSRLKSVSVSLGFTLVALAATLLAPDLSTHAASCRQWDISGHWTLSQTNGYTVKIDLSQDGSNITGSAFGSASSKSSEVLTTGSLDGSVEGNSLQFSVYWQVGGGGAVGEYRGTINPRGRLEGDTYDKMDPHSRAGWHSNETGGKCADSGVAPQSAPASPVPVKPREPDLRKGLQKPGKFFQQ